MANNYSIKFPKENINEVIKKIYPRCTIESVANRKNKAVIANVVDKTKAAYGRLNIYFTDFDCFFCFNRSFKEDLKAFDNLRVLYLEEMVKFFTDTNYIQELERYYCEKIEIGNAIMQDKKRTDKKSVKQEIIQAFDEIKYLKGLVKTDTLEK